MTTAIHTNTTAIACSVEALRHRILAAEADLNALIAVRTDADAIQRTEATYRGLIVKQDRYRRLVRQLARRLEAAAGSAGLGEGRIPVHPPAH